MKKICSYSASLLFSLSLCLSPSQGHCQIAPSNGLQWLTSVQQAAGYWGDWTTPTVRNTTAAAETFQIFDPAAPSYATALQWLATIGLSNNDYVSRRITLFSKTTNDISTDINYLLSARKKDGGWGIDSENESGNFNTALALQALKAANYSDATVLYQAINFLNMNQNADGGWGFHSANGALSVDPSNAYVTAIVLRTLSSFSSQFSVQSSVDKAKAYLLTKQNADGGFGSSPSNVYESALSVMALVSSGSVNVQAIQNAVGYLETAQSANGSWNDDPYSTALALQALASAQPNLSLSTGDISLSKAMPRENESITITAIVRNTGFDTASNISVRFYSGDPSTGGTQIGVDQVIQLLALGSTAQASITQSFTGTGGKTIFVVVDPDNLIAETSESDNKSSARVWVATAPDLAVFSEDLKPETSVPTSGTAFTLEYRIRNLGESAADAFVVSLYDGDPASGGTLLQSGNISGLSGTEVRTGTFGVTLTGDGPHTLYLVADSGSQITELSETNNTGTVTVTVGGTQTGADLVVTSADITLNPSRPTIGQSVAISARMRNQGAEAAFGFIVEIYDGSPDAGGTLIKSETISLAAGGEQIVSANWSIPTGIHDLYVVLDRMNGIVESDESNNHASVRVMTDMIDLSVSATDLSFNPAHPVSNDTVALTLTAHNTGIKNTGPFNLALYNGDPAAGGVLLQTYPVSNILGDNSVTLTYTFTASPQTYRFYAVADTENVVTEMYEENNIAIRSLKIKAPGEVLGPDLVPVKIDLSDTTTDSQTLAISGNTHVTFQNIGDDKITTSFNVLVFEDRDNDGQYTAGLDNLLGTSTMVTGPTASIPAIWPEGAGLVNVPLSGTVTFLHSPLYALIDSSDAILEQEDTNNIMRSGADCEVVPTNPIQPTVKWRWKQPNLGWNISATQVPPIIAHVTDDNGDGKIDEHDIPAIIINASENYSDRSDLIGKLWAFRGDTGAQLFTQYLTDHPIDVTVHLAAGDIDDDGKAEIISTRRRYSVGGVLAYKNDGTFLWDNQTIQSEWNQLHPWNNTNLSHNMSPAIADVNGDGRSDILVGTAIYNGDGSVRCSTDGRYGGRATATGFTSSTVIADVDMDGLADIVAGNTVYNNDCTLKWWKQALPDGLNAVGNLNDDPYPEIVLATDMLSPGPAGLASARLYLLDHNGNVLWGPIYLSQVVNSPYIQRPGHPIIADFDGDGKKEIGVRQWDKYLLFDGQGNLKKTITMPYSDFNYDSAMAPTVFDLNGDGRPEILTNAGGYFSIFSGTDGSVLFQDRFCLMSGGRCASSTSILYQNVIVADLNGDGHAEVLVGGFDNTNFDGLRVYGSANNDWVNTRSIWNQASYHVTNVNDDGSIPRYEAPSWLLNNTYRTQAAIGPNPNPYLTPNLTASYLRAAQNSAGVHFTVRIGNGGAIASSAGVSINFYNGPPSGSGQLIGSASTSKVLQPGHYEDVSVSWTNGSAGPHDIYAVVNGANAVSECNTDDNQVMLTVTIQGPGAVFGPDLIPIRLETSSVVTDPMTLSVTGSARVTLQNTGDNIVATAFTVVVFEDMDNDGRYTSGVDKALGTGANTFTLLPNGANIVNVPISGQVAFLSAPLSVMVDSTDVVMEQNEDNNVLRAAAACEVRPSSPIQPVLKWKWRNGQYPSVLDNVSTSPVVAPYLHDDNQDGAINELDDPYVLFISQSNLTLPGSSIAIGRLHAVNGRTGQELFSYSDLNHRIDINGSAAVGDINNDGLPEIIIPGGATGGGGVICLNSNGQLLWDNFAQAKAWTDRGMPYYGYVSTAAVPAISDIDGDGNPDIIVGRVVYNNDGSVKWGFGDTAHFARGFWGHTEAADLDMDGKQEVSAGNTAYNFDGSVKWINNNIPDGFTAIGNLDDDAYPEIAYATAGSEIGGIGGTRVYLLDHDGSIKWGPVHALLFEPGVAKLAYPSPPVIADFDGDGEKEIGFRGYTKFIILDRNGNLKQTLSLLTNTGGGTVTATVFDLDGDGKPEVLFNTGQYFRIFDGSTGTLLYEQPFGGFNSAYQNIVVADVDGDGHAEIVVVGGDNSQGYAAAQAGVNVYGALNNNWINARRIWNQPGYHVTNVNDDGSIPQHEAPSWLVNNTYRCQAATGVASGQTGTSYSTPNLNASYFRVTYDGADLNLLVRVGNSGAADAPAGAVVTFYDGAPSTNTIVGTVPLSRDLRPGEYQDVAYSISSAAPGVHQLYVVVDSANVVSECNKGDNQVQLDYTVQTHYPDLVIGSEDISLPTGTIYQGSIVPVAVNIRNIGAEAVTNIKVRLYNGNPSNGGTPAGTDIIVPVINPGSTATAVFSYDTLGRPGTNVLYVSADPDNTVDETNETNNMAPQTVDIQPPVLPDLAITVNDIQLSPAAAAEGDSVIVTALVMNRGTAIGNIPVRIAVRTGALGEGSEVYAATRTVYPVIDLGQSATVQAAFNTIGWSGQHAVVVTIDPSNAIIESSKSNNSASKPVFVQSAGLATSAVLDKPVYQTNEAVTSTITITDNTNTTRSLALTLFVQDSAGNRIATIVPADPITIAPNGSITLTRTWNTGSTFAGTYTIVAEMAEAGKVKATTSAGFTINADRSMNAGITVDRVSYNPNQSVTLTSTITSRSANYVFENLTAGIAVRSEVGGVSSEIYTASKAIATLMPGAAFTFKSFWNTGTYSPGAYPVTVEVRDPAGALIASGTATITITDVIKPSAALRGTMSVDKQSLLTGEPVSVSYSVNNIGNIDLAQVGLSVLTVHAVNQTVYNTITSQASITMGGLFSSSGTIDTSGYSAKDYLVVLRANINGIEETLAGTYFRVEGAPSAPSLAGPVMGSDVLVTMPTLSVNNASDPNDDELTYEFEVYADAAMNYIIAAELGVGSSEFGVTSWTIPVTLTENQTYFWRSRAYDGRLYGDWMSPASFRVNTLNDPPTAPTISSPADTSTVDTLTPALVVNNASDPDSTGLTYNFDIALDPAFTQIVASKTGVFEGTGTPVSTGAGYTSWQVPSALTENTTYYWRCQADDWLIIGPWMTTASFFVNTANDAPTAPAIIAPLNNSVVTTLSTDIVVTNSTDPDSPALTYFFEADTVPTFDSPGIIRSGPSTDSGQATATWHAVGLQDNTRYFVRAKASDGTTDSSWSVVIDFFANTANDAPTTPTLANPSNGAGVNTFTPTLSVHNSTDPDRDVLTYAFEVYGDAELATLVTTTEGVRSEAAGGITSWTVPVSLTENATYYWRSRASDGMLTSEWMPKASFMVNTANDAPGAPQLSSPAEGSSVATLTPTVAITNAVDPDSDTLTYEFEVYAGSTLVRAITNIAEDASGITSITLAALNDNTVYQWRARAYDGDRYGEWMAMASFFVHVSQMNVNATINFDPDTLNKKSNGNWVTVYIELPVGYNVADIVVSSIRLNGTISAESWPYAVGDQDKDGIPDLMVKFKRSDVINLLPNGEHVPVHATGNVGTTSFDGVDIIRVIK